MRRRENGRLAARTYVRPASASARTSIGLSRQSGQADYAKNCVPGAKVGGRAARGVRPACTSRGPRAYVRITIASDQASIDVGRSVGRSVSRSDADVAAVRAHGYGRNLTAKIR
jgi:hypothetical protein